MKWLKLNVLAAFSIAIGIGISSLGCSSHEAEPQGKANHGTGLSTMPEDKKLRIAVIPKGATHEFWKAIHAGAQKAGDELGVEIIWKGPLKEDDREDQIKVVEDFTTQKVDGIVLAPLDDTALRLPVDNAQKAGIPVVIMDSGLKDIETVSFVATDNEKGGELGGERLILLLADSPVKNVVMLRYQEGSASTTDRENGFLNAMKKSPDVKVLSSNQFGGATTESAQKASENLISRYKKPDGTLEFAGVFCPNESTTFGMLRALQDAGLAGKVKFVGFDSSSKLVEALSANQIGGLVLQDPFNMGYTAVKTLVSHLKKEKVEKRIDTGAKLVTPENMASDEMKKLLSPPQL